MQKEEIEQLKISLEKSKVHINSLIQKFEENQNMKSYFRTIIIFLFKQKKIQDRHK